MLIAKNKILLCKDAKRVLLTLGKHEDIVLPETIR